MHISQNPFLKLNIPLTEEREKLQKYLPDISANFGPRLEEVDDGVLNTARSISLPLLDGVTDSVGEILLLRSDTSSDSQPITSS